MTTPNPETTLTQTMPAERFDVVVIGGGQAGLATGYHLAKRDLRFVILDASDRVGQAWRDRWDSLRVFTPAWYDSLPGVRFPAPRDSFPSKDEIADYLETYAASLHLPVRSGHRVDELSRADDGRPGYLVGSGDRLFEAEQVVVATGAYEQPRVPDFAGELDPSIRQFHSRDYRNPRQLRDGGVAIVGASNSGAEISLDVARSNRTWLIGRDVGEIPIDTQGRLAPLFDRVIIFGAEHIMTMGNPIGRRAAAGLRGHGLPVERAKAAKQRAAGVERIYARVVGVRDGCPLLDDGRTIPAANVIWSTGYRPDFGWIQLPVVADDGWPIQHRGVVASAPGLYFVGLLFQHSISSSLIGGVGRDAGYVAGRIAAHRKAANARRKRDVPRLTPAT